MIAACVKKEMNLPPELILVGVKPRTIKTADQLMKQGQDGESVPLFQQQGQARWKYKGMFRAVKYTLAEDQPDLIEEHRRQAEREGEVTGMIQMECTSD